MLGGPQLDTVMPEVSDRITEQVLEAHEGPEPGRIPPGGVTHRQIPMARLEAVNSRK
jgi:hypothetical protein